MNKKASEWSQIIDTLQQLHKKYPTYNMGRHLSTALDEYPDIWGLSNKEFLFALNKYAAELEFNVISDDDKFLQQVIADSETMFDIVDTEDEEDI